jgi:hypothetical protein
MGNFDTRRVLDLLGGNRQSRVNSSTMETRRVTTVLDSKKERFRLMHNVVTRNFLVGTTKPSSMLEQKVVHC